MRNLSLVMGLFVLFIFNVNGAQAKSADAFLKRFQVVRAADGKLLGIRDRSLTTSFSVTPYVNLIKSQLLEEQALLSPESLASGRYDSEVRSVLEENMDFNFTQNQREVDENLKITILALKKLSSVSVENIFSSPLFLNVIGQFQGKMGDAIMLLDPTMIANVNDSSYFYKKNVSYKAVTWGLDLARKMMGEVPMLNTISYVIVQVEKLITERRQFHQNMLLHYLENFKEEELGLTHEEVNLIWSSIYESRISWYAFWESNIAKSNWAKYGVENFYAQYRSGTGSLKKSSSLYSEFGERMNYAFQQVTYNNEKVVINLFDNEGMFQNRPAIAHNFDHPTQVIRRRVLLTLAGLGLSFVPLSSMIKDNVSSFLKSYYEQQKITEGALYGYFESMGDTEGRQRIFAQYLNPFDPSLL